MSQDNIDSHDGIQALNRRLENCGDAVVQFTAEHNYYAANENAFVARHLLQMAKGTKLEELTAERVELTARLAWGLCELENGNNARIKDDLEEVEKLADEVYEQ